MGHENNPPAVRCMHGRNRKDGQKYLLIRKCTYRQTLRPKAHQLSCIEKGSMPGRFRFLRSSCGRIGRIEKVGFHLFDEMCPTDTFSRIECVLFVVFLGSFWGSLIREGVGQAKVS